MLSKQEAQDGYDIVEWIAKQSWCDGNIGMIGISYFAMVQLIVTAEQPPRLKAIFPYDTPADIYRHGLYDGGLLSLFYMRLWPPISAKNFVSDTIKSVSTIELNKLIEEAKPNPDISSKPELHNLLVNSQNAVLIRSLIYSFRTRNNHYFNIIMPKASLRSGDKSFPYHCHILGLSP